MTPLSEIRNGVLEHALTAGLANREQDHHLHNATPDVDSLAEILTEIGRTAQPGTRTRILAVEGLRLVKHLQTLNNIEYGCERDLAGEASRIPERAPEKGLTIKQAASRLRPLLADLANPLIRGAAERERLDTLCSLLGQVSEANLRSATMRGELGKGKHDLLVRLLDDTAHVREAEIVEPGGGGMSWTKLAPIGPVRTGCLCCAPKPETLPLGDVTLHPGFGAWSLTRDDETVLYDVHGDGEDAFVTQDCEDAAAGDPDHDWRIRVDGPLGGVVYQRHAEGEWYAVERLDGFA